MIRAAERERPDVRAARQAWAAEVLPSADPNRVVFVDETAANTKFDRAYGYAPKGEPVQIPRSELARPRPQPNGCGATVSAAGRECGMSVSRYT